ncbi:B3 domain-containing Os03g0621600 [Olea europaea subsp. europaea]|nr:B3 domain-containing Os03g0621600 [Olea europaea subsp. europaea]
MLGTSSNLFWKVHINKINDYLFFEEGWPEFIQESSLAHGEFLTFSYAGGSKFYVKIFATNGCRKSVAPHRNTKYEPFKLCQGNEASRPGKSYSIEAPRGNLHGRDLAVRKSGGKCHSFEMVMTKTYIHKGLLVRASTHDFLLSVLKNKDPEYFESGNMIRCHILLFLVYQCRIYRLTLICI